jgi:hypothetical protein
MKRNHIPMQVKEVVEVKLNKGSRKDLLKILYPLIKKDLLREIITERLNIYSRKGFESDYSKINREFREKTSENGGETTADLTAEG